jgi:monovalent cation:H+ antiporter, CPA1 family
VLTITEEHFDADTVDTLQAMTFGVVLFTLLIQGTTIAAYMRRLGLVGRADSELVQQRYQARIHMARAGQRELQRLGREGVVFSDLADSLSRIYERDARDHATGLRTHFGRNPELEVAMLLQARREALTAERTALTDILRTGMIETSVAEGLSVELSNRLAVLDLLEERWESDPVPTFERDGDDA